MIDVRVVVTGPGAADAAVERVVARAVEQTAARRQGRRGREPRAERPEATSAETARPPQHVVFIR